MSKTSRLAGFSSSLVCGALVLLAVACSSAPDGDLSTEKQPISPGGKGGGGGSGSSGGSTSGGGGGGDETADVPKSPTQGTDGGTTTADPDVACYSKAEDACEECCETAHPAATTAYEDAYDACICGAAGVVGKCATECAATYCNDDGPDETEGDACDLCQKRNAPEDGTGACDAQIAAALAKAPQGAALNNCWEHCP